MKVICLKDVVVSDKTVYKEGEVYTFNKVKQDGKTVSYEGYSDFGKGVWMKSDPTFKGFFMKKKKFDNLQEKHNDFLDAQYDDEFDI